MKIQVKTLTAADAGELELSDAVFGKEPRLDILHRVVTWQLEKRRGTAHGPRVRDFDPSLNKKIRRLGLATALSVKAQEGKLIVVEDLNLGEAKTKAFLASMGALGITSGLFIDGAAVDVGFARASANVPHIDVLPAIGANVYDILKHDTLVLTRAAVSALEARVNG